MAVDVIFCSLIYAIFLRKGSDVTEWDCHSNYFFGEQLSIPREKDIQTAGRAKKGRKGNRNSGKESTSSGEEKVLTETGRHEEMLLWSSRGQSLLNPADVAYFFFFFFGAEWRVLEPLQNLHGRTGKIANCSLVLGSHS